MAIERYNRRFPNLLRSRRVVEDFGLGNRIGTQGERLLNPNGSLNVVRTGLRAWSPYQSMLEMNWGVFFIFILLYYILINGLFGVIIVLLGVENVAGIRSGTFMQNFEQAFFFSIQTFTTVGYGGMMPQGMPAHIMAAIIALFGNISFALSTGLFFARFSKPKAQILFSKNALVTNHRNSGERCLQFRIVNIRNNKIINLKVKVIFSWLEECKGRRERRFQLLLLERDEVTLFPLNWTIVHYIDDSSPLYQKSKAELVNEHAEILIQIEGYDETFAQNVHINSSYIAKDLLCDVQFKPMYYADSGKTILELNKIHDIE
ncbi:MAG: ion channel [Saprospiraceae bacterium]